MSYDAVIRTLLAASIVWILSARVPCPGLEAEPWPGSTSAPPRRSETGPLSELLV